MIKYLLRRIGYILPIVLMVNLITFVIFFVINTPDDIARAQLGGKYTTQAAVEQWKLSHGYDLPLFYNQGVSGSDQVTQTLFVKKSLQLLEFDFGSSLSGRDITAELAVRMGPSLLIAVPTLLLGVLLNIVLGLVLLSLRRSYLGQALSAILVMMMSISGMFYIIASQYWLAKLSQLAPISGWQSGFNWGRFIWLPVFVSVISGLGVGSRWYLAIFAEEFDKDYVITAKAKGCSEVQLLFKQVLPNGLVTIVTGVVAILPLLFMGSLLVESFFSIPGLGSYVLDAINQQDFEVVRVMVFIGTLLYLLGLILTDIVYVLVDPRMRDV